MRRAALSTSLVLLAIAACSGQPSPSTLPAGRATALHVRNFAGATPISHVVIIVQENRTPDYLFQGVPGADISKTAIDSKGQPVQLQPVSLAAPYDLGHTHNNFITDYDNGKMDGFDRGLPQRKHLRPFGYAPKPEVQPYFDMATQYTFGDHMFETNQSDSFPAHQYIISGIASALPATTDDVFGNAFSRNSGRPDGDGCDAQSDSVVQTIDPISGRIGPTPAPCFDRTVLSDLLDAKHVSWKYYQHGTGKGLWHAFDAIQHVRYGPDYANVIPRAEQILTDISSGRLPDLAWVMPASDVYSDHAGTKSALGPSWVAAIVNAIGESQYWNSTAIIITWDDWGGWYDHLPPQQFNKYELGFRVPLVVISPYARPAYVSKVQHEFGSILAFSEETFGIPKGSLGSTDVRADDLSDCFNYSQQPITFTPIPAPTFKPSDALLSRPDTEDP
jgi:phospholipase C